MFRFSVRSNWAHTINWHEWGQEAFQKAQGQDKLVLLDLTAFWCGFCQRVDETALSDDEVIPLVVTVTGAPGDPVVLALARAALTQLGHRDVVLRFQEDLGSQGAKAEVDLPGKGSIYVSSPAALKPELLRSPE